MNKEYQKRLLIFTATITGIVLWILLTVGAFIYSGPRLAILILFFPVIAFILFYIFAMIVAIIVECWTWVKDAKRFRTPSSPNTEEAPHE